MLRRRTAPRLRLLRRTLTSIVFVGTLAIAQPGFADWDSAKETAADVSAKALDAVVVRPLSTVRVIIGAALMVPSSILVAPSGREGYETAYDVLIVGPMDYAFERELGSF